MNTGITRRNFLKVSSSAAAASCLAPAASSEAEIRPNVLFIMTDQQFADAMSCRMGDEYIHTPAMDSLAETGTLFTRAYTPNPICMPARNSIFTGRYPHETGVTKNERKKLDPVEFMNMGNYFRNAGYETAYFGKWHLSFDKKDVEAHGFETTGSLQGKGHDSEVADLTVKFLEAKRENADKPFLLVSSLSNPHDVCQLARGEELPSGPIGDPPPPADCPPAPANLAPPENETDTMATLRVGYQASKMFPVGDFTLDQWRQHRWGYYRLIEHVDALIGNVLSALREAGLEENTLIIFTSDHGECSGAHSFNQKTVFYEESTRVPLIVSFKGKTKKNVSDKFSNTGIDIIPTMLDFAGIPVPEKLPGRSLRPIVIGEDPANWRDHVVIQNHLSQAAEVDGLLAVVRGRMVRSEQYKYCIYDKGIRRESLVDLHNDPLETKNVATDPAYRAVLIEHRELLRAFGAKYKDALVETLLANDVGPIPFTPKERA